MAAVTVPLVSAIAARPSWVEYYMDLAFCVSMRSKDPKRMVGCVIVHPESLRILSMGYNGFPPGTENTEENWGSERDEKAHLVVHAEANAVILAGQADLEGSIAFVTMFPCLECAKMLIAKGIRKVYYLSMKEKYPKKSFPLFKAAEVEVVPLKRGSTLEEFEKNLMDKVDILLNQGKEKPVEPNETYKELLEKNKHKREDDLESQWPRKFIKDEILKDKWKDYFLFLALIASTRALKSDKEYYQGALLIDSKTLKISAISYKGYPRGVPNDIGDDSMQVSALLNAICLRFSEGNKCIAFSTHFPKPREAKMLAQAQVQDLYFIWPKILGGDDQKSLQIMKCAEMNVMPLDLPNSNNIKEAISKTIEKLKNAESENERHFSDWPSYTWTDYELQPKKPTSL